MAGKKGGQNSSGDDLLTLSEFVKEVGAAKTTVLEAIQKGRIHATKKGRVWQVPKSMVKVWQGGVQPLKPSATVKAGTHGQRVISTYEAENRKKVAQAELAEMQLAELKGDLIPKAEVISFSFKATRKIRDNILGVPNRISNELAAEPDPHQVHVMLENALTEALDELASMIEKWDENTLK